MFQTGLKAKEISTILNIEYNLVRKIIRKAQEREWRQRPENKAKAREYQQKPENKEKALVKRQRPENKAKVKEYNQRPENKTKKKEYNQRPENKAKEREYQKKTKAKDPEGYKRKKNESFAKNYPINKDRISKRYKLDRQTKKKTVFEHYSQGKLVCNCCKLDGNYGRIVGLDF
ncbi:MAG: hypothetical protein O3B47_04610, partial [bacterium]|nr:hypothetical protein [bacterium]